MPKYTSIQRFYQQLHTQAYDVEENLCGSAGTIRKNKNEKKNYSEKY